MNIQPCFKIQYPMKNQYEATNSKQYLQYHKQVILFFSLHVISSCCTFILLIAKTLLLN